MFALIRTISVAALLATIVSQSDALVTFSSNAVALRFSSCDQFLRPSNLLVQRCSKQSRKIQENSIQWRTSPRRVLTLRAVAEKIDAELLFDNPQNTTSIHELANDFVPEYADKFLRQQPSLTVVAGRGVSVQSSQSGLHNAKSTVSGVSVHEESIRPSPPVTVTPGRGVNITSVSPGVAIGERSIPEETDQKHNSLPLPIIKTPVGRSRNKGVGAVGKVLNSIRTVAAARTLGAADAPTTKKKTSNWKSNIQSTVSDVLRENETRLQNETNAKELPDLLPRPGTILLHGSDNGISIRSSIPHSSDDKFIANLRLSVFSNFDAERQNLFRSRSVEVLNRRRRRGAVALVAEMPSVDFRKVQSKSEMNSRIATGHLYGSGGVAFEPILTKEADHQNELQNVIIGSVECSIHEFDRTILGNSRPKNSLMYVTEVAVCPEVRRCGAGRMLMRAAEEVATIRGIESMYLHVDVTNHAAIAMYEEAGYCKMDKTRPIYAQFTASLNLHDGALMGRCHHLMCKNLTDRTTWINGVSTKN